MKSIRALFLHDDWAFDRLIRAAAALKDEQLDRPFEMGLGTLRETLRHLWRTEAFWLDRWLGNPHTERPPDEPPLSVEELRDRFRATAGARDAFVDRAGEAGGSRIVSVDLTPFVGRTYELPLGRLMLHVCNHAFHHRAQALNMLRRVGGEATMLDYLGMVVAPGAPQSLPCDLATILDYYAYADWARHRLDEVVRDAPAELLDRPFEIGLGTIRKTLLHIRDAEQWWLENWSGLPADRFVQLPDTTTPADLEGLFAETASRRDAFIAGLDDGDMQRPVTARPKPDMTWTFGLGDSMLQLCGHGTQHRAQIVNMLRQGGIAAPPLDLFLWAAEAGAGAQDGVP